MPCAENKQARDSAKVEVAEAKRRDENVSTNIVIIVSSSPHTLSSLILRLVYTFSVVNLSFLQCFFVCLWLKLSQRNFIDQRRRGDGGGERKTAAEQPWSSKVHWQKKRSFFPCEVESNRNINFFSLARPPRARTHSTLLCVWSLKQFELKVVGIESGCGESKQNTYRLDDDDERRKKNTHRTTESGGEKKKKVLL